MADQEPPSFMKELGQDIVTVHIGPEKIPFIVHKDLLTQCSPYFKAAFEGNFCEALENSIPLIDISTTQFRLFLDWLYFRRLPNQSQKLGLAGCMNCKPTGVRCSNATGDSDEPQIELLSSDDEQRLEDLIETGPWYKEMLYVLADRCDVPVLRKLLINQEWTSRQHTPRSFAPVIYALRKLPSKSPWNKLSIDVYSELYEARQDVVCQTEVLLRQNYLKNFWSPSCAASLNLANVVLRKRESSLDGCAPTTNTNRRRLDQRMCKGRQGAELVKTPSMNPQLSKLRIRTQKGR